MPAVCPTLDNLKQFRLGRLSEGAAQQVEQHLHQCAACLAQLPGLPLNDPLVNALRGIHQRPRLNNPLLTQVQQELRAQPFRPREKSAPAPVEAYQPTCGGPPQSLDVTVGPPPKGIEAGGTRYPFLSPPKAAGELGWLGSYRVLRVLGEGGMGLVLLAEDPRLQRQVALKVMKPLLAAEEGARRRFLREARATARLSHDHIVPIHHIDEANGVPFLAMPLLQGQSLDDRLKREGLLPVAEVLRIGREIAEGLAIAHQNALIHRDIKPGNIWLESPRGRVKILDFGLASMPCAEGEKTLPGTILGTPGYMAPEQTEGQGDHRVDLFSLGCVLYYMATGRPPIKGGTMMEKIRSTLFETPTPPQQINTGLPEPLCRLILRLLSRKPEDRPDTALAVARVLQELQTQTVPGTQTPQALLVSATDATVPIVPVPLLPGQPLWQRRLRRLVSGHRLHLLGVGAAMLVLIVVMAWPRKPRPVGNEVVEEGKKEELFPGARRPYVRVRPPEDAESSPQVAIDRGFPESWVTNPEPIEGLKGWCIETNDIDQVYPDAFALNADDQLLIRYTARQGIIPPGWRRFDSKTCGLVPAPFDGQYAALTPDDRTCARVVAGGVQLWDEGSPVPRVTLRSPGPQYTVSFSPNGKTVVTTNSDSNSYLTMQHLFWDRKEASKLAQCQVADWTAASSLAWSPDSKALATPSNNGRIFLLRAPWTAAPKELRRPAVVHRLAWSPKADLLATVEGDGELHLIDLDKGEDIVKLPKLKVAIDCVPAWSPDGNELAIAMADQKIQVWDMEKKKITFTFTGHKRPLTAVAFLMDGRTLVSGSKGSVRFWDLQKSCLRGSLVNLANAGWVAIGPDGNYRCSEGGEQRFVYKFRQTNNELRDLPPEDFRKVFGWKNHPDRVQLTGK